MRQTLHALATRLVARAGWIALAIAAVFAAYQLVIFLTLSLGLGGWPTYAKLYPVWVNARRIVAGTPALADVVTLVAREPILEYGRRHPTFGAAVWSFELTWSSLLFFLSFSALLGIYLGLAAGGRTGWAALGSLGGAGVVGLFGASVSSLTSLRPRLVRRAPVDRRHLGADDPVVRSLRVVADRRRLRARPARDHDPGDDPHRGSRRGPVVRVAILLGLCLALVGCGARVEPMPAFTLTNQSGQPVGLETLRGHAAIITFMFTSCRDVCPLLTAQLTKVQAQAKAEGLDGRVRFVSITVDPLTDTPEALTRYAAGYGADLATWHFLTGGTDEVNRLTREIGLLTGVGDKIGHGNLLLFVDPSGRIAERYTGLELEPTVVLPKIRRLLG